MIPPFNEHGYLPPGVHLATMEEIEERFGRSSEIRRTQMESLRWLLDLARRAGVQRLVINGSFVTDILEPNDVDCAILLEDEFDYESKVGIELANGFPFLEIKLTRQSVFGEFLTDIFATDRYERTKGMVEIKLWN